MMGSVVVGDMGFVVVGGGVVVVGSGFGFVVVVVLSIVASNAPIFDHVPVWRVMAMLVGTMMTMMMVVPLPKKN
jgi:hypothetical protein